MERYEREQFDRIERELMESDPAFATALAELSRPPVLTYRSARYIALAGAVFGTVSLALQSRFPLIGLLSIAGSIGLASRWFTSLQASLAVRSASPRIRDDGTEGGPGTPLALAISSAVFAASAGAVMLLVVLLAG